MEGVSGKINSDRNGAINTVPILTILPVVEAVMAKTSLPKSNSKSKKTLSQVDRFWSQVQKTKTCWLWTGCRRGSRNVYGSAYFNGKLVLAHRLSYYLAHGEWPLPYCLHSCDNPPCVNPAHLRPGTDADNHADASLRQRKRAGEDHYRAKLTEVDVRRIRKLRKDGWRCIEIAALFPQVHRSTIGDVYSRKSWKRVVE